MSYRDIQTAIGVGSQVGNMAAQFLGGIPGLGQVVGLVSDVVGAVGLAGEQEAYNRRIWNYYATPVSQGGGLNPGTRFHSYRSFKRRQMRALFNRSR